MFLINIVYNFSITIVSVIYYTDKKVLKMNNVMILCYIKEYEEFVQKFQIVIIIIFMLLKDI
jgi:hypothetical protein